MATSRARRSTPLLPALVLGALPWLLPPRVRGPHDLRSFLAATSLRHLGRRTAVRAKVTAWTVEEDELDPDGPSSDEMVRTRALEGDISGAVELIKQMCAEAESPSKDAFAALIDACARQQALPQVAKLLADLLEGNVVQERIIIIAYKHLISVSLETQPEDRDLAKCLLNNVQRLKMQVGKASISALKDARMGFHLQSHTHPFERILKMLAERKWWPEALRQVGLLHEKGVPPEHRACQRWISKLNVDDGNAQELTLLDSIMRLALGMPPLNLSKAVFEDLEGAPLERLPAFQAGQAAPLPRGSLKSILSDPGNWSVLQFTSALERQPPNHYDLNIFSYAPSASTFGLPPSSPARRHQVPGVEGAFVLSNVLSAAEAVALIVATESMGYTPDLPLNEEEYDGRAPSVVLLASEAQNDELFLRVKDLLPSNLDGDAVLGLNRRWRFYRYKEGNVYRKHLDGSWPASGETKDKRGERRYMFDAHAGTARSRLTFIIYLNDNFQGGATTFFVPQRDQPGKMEATPVKPVAGFATVFTHGDTGVPLLHEGSPVTEGTKYILRTDVVYESHALQETLRRNRYSVLRAPRAAPRKAPRRR